MISAGRIEEVFAADRFGPWPESSTSCSGSTGAVLPRFVERSGEASSGDVAGVGAGGAGSATGSTARARSRTASPRRTCSCSRPERWARPRSARLVVEDTVPGVLAGKAAGMTVWGFTGGSHCAGRDAASWRRLAPTAFSTGCRHFRGLKEAWTRRNPRSRGSTRRHEPAGSISSPAIPRTRSPEAQGVAPDGAAPGFAGAVGAADHLPPRSSHRRLHGTRRFARCPFRPFLLRSGSDRSRLRQPHPWHRRQRRRFPRTMASRREPIIVAISTGRTLAPPSSACRG